MKIFSIVTLIINIFCIILSFFHPLWAWLPFVLVVIYLYLTSKSFQSRKYKQIDQLSFAENELFKKFGYIYELPFATKDYSSACSSLILSAPVLAIIGAFQGQFLGIGLCVFFFLVLSHIELQYNPIRYFKNDPEILDADKKLREWFR